jgi:hypothetical protein
MNTPGQSLEKSIYFFAPTGRRVRVSGLNPAPAQNAGLWLNFF